MNRNNNNSRGDDVTHDQAKDLVVEAFDLMTLSVQQLLPAVETATEYSQNDSYLLRAILRLTLQGYVLITVDLRRLEHDRIEVTSDLGYDEGGVVSSSPVWTLPTDLRMFEGTIEELQDYFDRIVVDVVEAVRIRHDSSTERPSVDRGGDL